MDKNYFRNSILSEIGTESKDFREAKCNARTMMTGLTIRLPTHNMTPDPMVVTERGRGRRGSSFTTDPLLGKSAKDARLRRT